MTTDDKKAINTSSTPSLWISDCPIKEYPVLTKDLSTQVLIIGGGITGLSCAYELTEAGFDVVLIEKDTLCSKATGNTTGKLTLQHSSQYSDLLAKNMTQAAQDLLASQTKAIARFREITAQLDIDCDQIETKAVLYGRTKSELKVIDKEQAAY
ncbi:MAG: FAD-binding oxidoreductase, partial [Clostridiaceae bacterium]